VDKLRIGVIGTGSVVREIYQYLYFRSEFTPIIRIEAICDPLEDVMNAFGSQWNIPEERRFTDYRRMLDTVELDAVAVNTPDSLHREPVMTAMERGLDVLLPKPTADKVADAHAMVQKVRETGCFLGVDFHKREDPLTKEARARYAEGVYGTLQSATWYMVDQLKVVDPNYSPRFFASEDFAERNTPVSFLTSHMADTFMIITGLKPVEIRATGYKQKLPSLQPKSVDGYDLVDTEILFESGCLCHIITGWALPNTAHGITTQYARLLGSEGMLELNLDRLGYHEILPDGIFERNVSFRNFEESGLVTGFGMRRPGRILRNILRHKNGEMSTEERRQHDNPLALGFYTTLVCDAAHRSLAQGRELGQGVIRGSSISVPEFLAQEIGEEAARSYL
jgi:predicted dehydrogenase